MERHILNPGEIFGIFIKAASIGVLTDLEDTEPAIIGKISYYQIQIYVLVWKKKERVFYHSHRFFYRI